MISWRLWRALSTPFVAHPIYWQRGVWKPKALPTRRSFWQIIATFVGKNLIWGVLAAFVITVVLSVVFEFNAMFVIGPVVTIFLGIPVLFFFTVPPLFLVSVGTVYGLLSALSISDSIAVEKQQGRYALMGLTPHGLAGATWALCSLQQHTNFILQVIRNWLILIYLLIGALILLPLLVVVVTFLSSLAPITASNMPVEYNILNVSLILTLPLIDYVQSSNIGSLIGMITPSFTVGRANTRGLTIFTFLALQFAVYLVMAFACFVLWPRLYVTLGWRLDLGYTLVCIMTSYLMREAVTITLWVYLAYSLETDLTELNRATNLKFTSITQLDPVLRQIG